MDQEYKKDILRLALFIGELMLKSGAETYRVEDSVLRICRSRGFKHINVFTSPTVIIISDERFDGLSFMKTIRSRSINLNKISQLNSFSREFVDNPDMPIKEAMIRLKELSNIQPYPRHIFYGFTGLGSAAFAVLLGGTQVANFIFTFIIAICSVIVFDKIMKLSSISAFSALMAAFFIAIAGVILTELGLLQTPKMLIVGSIMPLLPGVSFIKGLRDLISGDLLSGVARAFDAGMTAIAIAAGVGFVLDVWFRIGGVF